MSFSSCMYNVRLFSLILFFLIHSFKKDTGMTSMDFTDSELENYREIERKKRSYTQLSKAGDPELQHLLQLPGKKMDEEEDGGEEPITRNQQIVDEERDLKSMEKYINNKLKLPKRSIPNINHRGNFEKLHDWLVLHLPDLTFNGRIAITLKIRYLLCTYIVAYLPAQWAFFFPRIIITKAPKTKVKLMDDFMDSFRVFLDFVKENSNKQLFVTFSIGKVINVKEELQFIKEIPNKILKDPIYIVRHVLNFDLKADGLEEYRAKAKNRAK